MLQRCTLPFETNTDLDSIGGGVAQRIRRRAKKDELPYLISAARSMKSACLQVSLLGLRLPTWI